MDDFSTAGALGIHRRPPLTGLVLYEEAGLRNGRAALGTLPKSAVGCHRLGMWGNLERGGDWVNDTSDRAPDLPQPLDTLYLTLIRIR